eukprot:10952065-Alexandrium_andersonii.AAC.1
MRRPPHQERQPAGRGQLLPKRVAELRSVSGQERSACRCKSSVAPRAGCRLCWCQPGRKLLHAPQSAREA